MIDQYKNDVAQLTKLTEEIKQNIFLNYADQSKLNLYEESCAMRHDAKTLRQVNTIYTELNQLLGESVKKTIDDALHFREQLTQSRKEILAGEICELQNNIAIRKQRICNLENERVRILSSLEAKQEIKKLTT